MSNGTIIGTIHRNWHSTSRLYCVGNMSIADVHLTSLLIPHDCVSYGPLNGSDMVIFLDLLQLETQHSI